MQHLSLTEINLGTCMETVSNRNSFLLPLQTSAPFDPLYCPILLFICFLAVWHYKSLFWLLSIILRLCSYVSSGKHLSLGFCHFSLTTADSSVWFASHLLQRLAKGTMGGLVALSNGLSWNLSRVSGIRLAGYLAWPLHAHLLSCGGREGEECVADIRKH